MKAPTQSIEVERLSADLARLRGDPAVLPEASIVIPVNAQADLDNVLEVVREIARYRGRRTFDLNLVINNYPAGETPTAVDTYTAAGMHVVAVPSVWRVGEAVCLSARVPGIRSASADRIVVFDADCRIPNPTLLLDWYGDQFDQGATLAYTRVGFFDLRPRWSVRARIFAHHAARSFKRVVLRIPTTAGANYAVDRSSFLQAYEQGFLVDDLNVGPALKALGGRVVYSGARRLQVLASGRKFRGGWLKLARYLRYRLMYNMRLLPVRPRVRRETPYHQKPLR
jgi:Glycosyltransferase like family 2